ncbi:MAG: acyltransferase [Polyangiaceae bacterium]
MDAEKNSLQSEDQSAAAAIHLPALDGVRGIAILLVLVFHLNLHVHFNRFANRVPVDFLTRQFVEISDVGWIGVDLFFVLSGFLITGILIDNRAATNFYRAFYARRALRIFPLYFAFLGALLIVLPLFVPISTPGYSSAAHNQWYLWAYCTNIGLARGIDFGPFNHFWSLAVEEHFYLFWPVLVRKLNSKRRVAACYFCIVAAFVTRVVLLKSGLLVAAGWLTPSRLDAFAFGALAAIAARGAPGTWPVFARRLLTGAIVLAAVLLVLSTLESTAFDEVRQSTRYTFQAAAFAYIIFLAATHHARSRLVRALSIRPLRLLGKYSYALYVLHFPLMPALYTIMMRGVLRIGNWARPSELAIMLIFDAFGIVTTLAVAMGSWYLFEKHFLKLKPPFLIPRPRPVAARTTLVVPS